MFKRHRYLIILLILTLDLAVITAYVIFRNEAFRPIMEACEKRGGDFSCFHGMCRCR